MSKKCASVRVLRQQVFSSVSLTYGIFFYDLKAGQFPSNVAAETAILSEPGVSRPPKSPWPEQSPQKSSSLGLPKGEAESLGGGATSLKSRTS